MHSLKGSKANHRYQFILVVQWFSGLIFCLPFIVFITLGYLHCFLLKLLKYFGLKLSVYIQYFVFVSLLCSVFKYFQILLHQLEYYTLMPLLDLISLMQILLVFRIGCVLDMQLIFVLLLIALHVQMIIYQLNVHCSHSLMIDLV